MNRIKLGGHVTTSNVQVCVTHLEREWQTLERLLKCSPSIMRYVKGVIDLRVKGRLPTSKA